MASRNLFDFWTVSLKAGQIMAESNLVIGLRLSGMAGMWPMDQAETTRMMTEKLQAGALAGKAAMRAGMSGGSLPDIAMAAMKPVGRRTRANAKRLTKNVGAKS